MTDSIYTPLRRVDLKEYNTLALPASAEYFAEPDNVHDLRQCLLWSQVQRVPVLAMGGGSNLVLCNDWHGLVVRYCEQCIEVMVQDDKSVTLRVGAGVNWHYLVEYCVEHGWHGLENLALIPGHVGAAPIQNIGAYGVELADVVTFVEGINFDDLETFVVSAEECQFGYRDSVFKRDLAGKVIITHVVFNLSKTFVPNLSYPVLAEAMAARTLNAAEVMQAVMDIRNSKLPDPRLLPNAGSFFKNPVVAAQQCQKMLVEYPDMPHYPQANGTCKLAAGWLIERTGWKGRSLGLVAMHDKQALVLVAQTGATGCDVLALAETVRSDVFQKFNVELEIEPQVIGHA